MSCFLFLEIGYCGLVGFPNLVVKGVCALMGGLALVWLCLG